MTKYDEVLFDRSNIGRTVASIYFWRMDDDREPLYVQGEAGTGDLKAAINLVYSLRNAIVDTHRRWRKAQADLRELRSTIQANAESVKEAEFELREARQDRDNLKGKLSETLALLEEMRAATDKPRGELLNELAIARRASQEPQTNKETYFFARFQQEVKRSKELEADLARANITVAQLREELRQAKAVPPEKVAASAMDPKDLEALKALPPHARALQSALAADEEAVVQGNWKAARQFIQLANMWSQLIDVDIDEPTDKCCADGN